MDVYNVEKKLKLLSRIQQHDQLIHVALTEVRPKNFRFQPSISDYAVENYGG